MRHFLIRVALLLASLPAFASVAIAHAYLHSATPAVGSTVSTPPTQVNCRFTEELEPSFSSIEVQDAAGQRVDAGDMHPVPHDAKEMIIGLRKIGPGTYTVIWHAVSIDTHHTQGRFTFTVAP